MKYNQQILEAFDRLGFSPRAGQIAAVNQILIEFIDNSVKNVVLSAPTGTGKSIIGAVTAEALSSVLGAGAGSLKSSISLVSTNTLATQYATTFDALKGASQYVMIKGANNYTCSALSTDGVVETADSCAWWAMTQAGKEFSGTLETECGRCDYLASKKQKNSTRHLTTNYSYFFIDRLYTEKFEPRDLVIWDEAHLINDLFSEHAAIVFSQQRLQATARELSETLHLVDPEIARLTLRLAQDIGDGKINQNNYRTYLNSIFKVYRWAQETGEAAAGRALRSSRMGEYSRLVKFTKKYEGLLCKIDDLFNYNYAHVFDHDAAAATVSIKPIFVSRMFEALRCSPRNLFMSATIDLDFMVTTLSLDPAQSKFIKLPATIDPAHKQVIFFDPQSLSYNSLQDPAVVTRLRKNCARIVKKHVGMGERGIILSPSFKLQEQLVQELRTLKPAVQMFVHEQGTPLGPVLDAFKAWNQGAAVLISPSIYEGIDLPHELSRFQVIVKAPFPSLADRRFKFILDNYNSIYTSMATMKLVQGAGRSVRAQDDHARTYMLDSNAQRLFTAPANIWKNEFDVQFTNFL